MRRKTTTIHIGNVPIGSGHPVVVQSMCNTDTRDVEATLRQIDALSEAGCMIARLAVVDQEAVDALSRITKRSSSPIIADIHFDYKLALGAIAAGVDGLRINPGNIGSRDRVQKVVEACRDRRLPIRIGVNGGSLDKKLLEKYGGLCPEAMVESAMENIRILEELNHPWMKISLKSSNVPMMIKAYEQLATQVDYPLHIGVTEAGGLMRGTVKSAVGLGILLHEGIGDTLRVSLTADPAEEVTVAWEILRALGLRSRGPEIISCPTCGRTEIDLFSLARAVEDRLATSKADIKVAVMGCVVNGPGEAREADLGVAGGRDKGIIFRKGEVIRSVKGQDALLAAFMEELQQLLNEKESQ